MRQIGIRRASPRKSAGKPPLTTNFICHSYCYYMTSDRSGSNEASSGRDPATPGPWERRFASFLGPTFLLPFPSAICRRRGRRLTLSTGSDYRRTGLDIFRLISKRDVGTWPHWPGTCTFPVPLGLDYDNAHLYWRYPAKGGRPSLSIQLMARHADSARKSLQRSKRASLLREKSWARLRAGLDCAYLAGQSRGQSSNVLQLVLSRGSLPHRLLEIAQLVAFGGCSCVASHAAEREPAVSPRRPGISALAGRPSSRWEGKDEMLELALLEASS